MTIEPTTTPNVLGSCTELTGAAARSSQEQLLGAHENVHPGTSLDSVHDKSGLPSIDCGENRHRTLLCCKCGITHKIPIDCGDRLCLSCNSRRARKLRKKWFPAMAIILKNISRHKLKFLTLTFKSKTKIQVDKLKKDFQRLRDRQIYKKAWAGGIYDIETKCKNGLYNLHIHAVVKGDYIPQKDISSDWMDITGDSFYVDIRSVKYRDKQRYGVAVKSVLNYLMKYITKPAENGIDWYDYNQAFGGRRLIQGWGCFYNVLSNDTLPFMCPNCEHSSWEILENLIPPHPRLIFNRAELSLDSFSDSSRNI